MTKKGLVVVVSGPSGSGKGTVLNVLRNNNSNIKYSISATTRKPRKNEVDGINYYFKSIDEFKNMIIKDELLEWVEYCDNYYGTPKSYIEETVNKGFDIIVEIEVEGAKRVIGHYPECVSIFLLPPSMSELKRRIVNRGTESENETNKRLDKARIEIKKAHLYEYVIINNDVDVATKMINDVLIAEKLRYNRNKGIEEKILKE